MNTETKTIAIRLQKRKTTFIYGTKVDVQQTTQVPSTLQQFKFAAAGLSQTTSSLDGAQGSLCSDVAKQLNSYISAVSIGITLPIDALDLWAQQHSKLVSHAQDLLSSPASQAYVVRIFSVCSWVTPGRHNTMIKSLEMRACLKLNSNVLKETGFVFWFLHTGDCCDFWT